METFQADHTDAGQRFDVVVSKRIARLSRARVQSLIDGVDQFRRGPAGHRGQFRHRAAVTQQGERAKDLAYLVGERFEVPFDGRDERRW